jgi:hypothetical protein
VSGDADFPEPSDPPASSDNRVTIDRPAFVARVGPSVDRAHELAQDILGDAQIAADVVRDVLDSLWARRDELTDDDLGLEPILLATRAAALTRRATQPVKAGALRAGTAQLS